MTRICQTSFLVQTVTRFELLRNRERREATALARRSRASMILTPSDTFLRQHHLDFPGTLARRRRPQVQITTLCENFILHAPLARRREARNTCDSELRTCRWRQLRRARLIQRCVANSLPAGHTSCRWRESS